MTVYRARMGFAGACPAASPWRVSGLKAMGQEGAACCN